jgi:hypothetical protein
MRTSLGTISFYKGTAAVLERAECLIGRDFGENLVVVPRAVRLFGLLDLTSVMVSPCACFRPRLCTSEMNITIAARFWPPIGFGP